MGVTADFANFVQDTAFSDLPAASVSRAKDLFLDTIGVALVGSVQSTGQAVVAYAKEAGGSPEASVWSGGLATSASMAAFTNGILAHNMDFDDWLPTGEEAEDWPRNGGHASGILVPVAVALGEKLGASGKSMIEAYVLGVEVYTKIAANCPNLRGARLSRYAGLRLLRRSRHRRQAAGVERPPDRNGLRHRGLRRGRVVCQRARLRCQRRPLRQCRPSWNRGGDSGWRRGSPARRPSSSLPWASATPSSAPAQPTSPT